MKSAAIDNQRLLRFLVVGLGALVFLFAACVGVVVTMVAGYSLFFLAQNLGRDLLQVLIIGVCGLVAWCGLWLVRAAGQTLGRRLIQGVMAGLLILVAGFTMTFYLSLWPLFRGAMQMNVVEEKAGHYMDSLTAKDIQSWIDRSKKLLAQQKTGEIPEGYMLFNEKLPEDLKKLNINLLYVLDDSVTYQWVGGLDHTALVVEKKDDGTFQVTAVYSDENSKVIWPKP